MECMESHCFIFIDDYLEEIAKSQLLSILYCSILKVSFLSTSTFLFTGFRSTLLNNPEKLHFCFVYCFHSVVFMK
jgi:hypothetical protein